MGSTTIHVGRKTRRFADGRGTLAANNSLDTIFLGSFPLYGLKSALPGKFKWAVKVVQQAEQAGRELPFLRRSEGGEVYYCWSSLHCFIVHKLA